MGLRRRSWSVFDKKSVSVFSHWKEPEVWQTIFNAVEGNPNPANYTIQSWQHIGDYLILTIKYHDCKNFEGDKILVFKNTTIEALKKQKLIDPHFSDNKNFISPVARFEPTEEGLIMSKKLCLTLTA